MRIGAKLPHSGDGLISTEVPAAAHALEAAGFDSLWTSDHIVLPPRTASFCPFTPDGTTPFALDVPFLEALMVLAAAAAVTERIELGTAALVLPQRNPILLAKQLATLDAMSDGRVLLGAGAGWVREEFDALDTPFESRGSRLTEWIALLRDCWTGHPREHTSEHYRLPAGTLVLPALTRAIPIYVGGHSRAALRRAGRVGDGWLAQQSLTALAPELLVAEIDQVRAAADAAGRDPDQLRIILRLVESAGRAEAVAQRLAEIAQAGVDEVIVDVNWAAGGVAADYVALRDAIGVS